MHEHTQNSLKPAVMNQSSTYSSYWLLNNENIGLHCSYPSLNFFPTFPSFLLTFSRGRLGFSLRSKTCWVRKLTMAQLGASALIFLSLMGQSVSQAFLGKHPKAFLQTYSEEALMHLREVALCLQGPVREKTDSGFSL